MICNPLPVSKDVNADLPAILPFLVWNENKGLLIKVIKTSSYKMPFTEDAKHIPLLLRYHHKIIRTMLLLTAIGQLVQT